MALESFYGGKPGISPVIRNSFKFIDKKDPAYIAKLNNPIIVNKLSPKEKALLKIDDTSLTDLVWDANTLKPFTMDECFADPTYRDVWYSELCIIDTENKMNPNNGKIFRRTLQRTKTAIGAGDTIYAEYIGQIVGPSGGVPNIFFGSIDSAREKAAGLAKTLETDGEITKDNPLDVSGWDYSYPTIKKDNNNNDIVEISTANITTFTPNTRSDDDQHIAILDSKNSGSIQLVPGKDSENKYKDDIRYTWCNVRRTLTNGGQEDAWIYLGFEIPYTVFDLTAEEKNYTYNGPIFTQTQIGTDNKEHPFYQNLHFYIPRGARGIGPEELFIVGKDGKQKPEKLYNFDAISYNKEKDIYSIPANTPTINPNESTYWVAKWKLYNPKTENAQEVYQYIGAYKDVSEINIDTNLKNSNGTDNNNYGKVTVKYSDGKIEEIVTLPLIKNAEYDPTDGLITFEHAGNHSVTTTNAISYISKMQILDDGTIQYKFNTDKETDDWENITDFNNNPVKIKDIIEAKIATSENLSEFNLISNPVEGHLYVRYRPEPNKWIDLGLVNINSTLGIVVQDTLKTDNEPKETISDWLNKLKTENKEINDDTNTAVISTTGKITVNGINKTGGFVAVTDNTDSNNPITYIVYYDPYTKKWINGGTLGGDINSDYTSGIYVQDENNQIIPTEDQKTTFTFITLTDPEDINNPLKMPWNTSLNYGKSN